MSIRATHEIARDTSWYKHPAQAEPPNGTLLKGTRVAILQDSGSYTQVQTEDETVTGYVETDALHPL